MTRIKILARRVVIHDLYLVGRKTAIKLSKANAKTIPKEILSESNENEEPTSAVPSDFSSEEAVVFQRCKNRGHNYSC